MSKYTRIAYLVLSLSLLGLSGSLAATFYTYTNGGSNGLWAVANTWTTDPSGTTLIGSAVPGNNDVVYILNGFTVTLDANVSTTGLTITVLNGGTLDLSTFTMSTINTLSGSGTLKIKAGYFPTVTTNNFLASYASGATVEFYDFTGTLPASLNYPNLTLTNTTSSSHTIRFANATAYSFTIFGNLITQNTGLGSLTVTLGTVITNVLTVNANGNVTIGAGSTLNTGLFNAVHVINITGNMINNGTVNLSNGTQYAASTTGAANVIFTGATNNTLACNGVVNFYSLTVDKGLSSTNILSVTSTSTANLNFYTSGKLYTVTNGTLRLGANITIPRAYGSTTTNYDLGSSTQSPMLWIDGATVSSGGSALVVYGKFRITAGSYTTMGGEGSVIREEGQYIIEGGTFTTEKFRPSTTAATHRGSFTITGGTFNASGTTNSNSGYARFSLPFPEQVFIMSGGVINVSNPEPAGGAANGGFHIGCNVANYNVTGGTVNAILSGTATTFSIASTAPMYNFNITRTGGTPTTVQLAGIGSISGSTTTVQPLVVLNLFTIDGTNTPVFNANGQNVIIGSHFTINSGGTYTPSSNTTYFNGAADQNFNNSGAITLGLYNLTLNKTGGALILGGSSTVYTVSQNLTLNTGIFNDGGKTVNVAGNVYTESIHTGTGNITLNGAITQTIGGDGNGIFGNLILNNASTPGALLTADLTISGTLTLAGTSNSLFDIQLYLLSLTSPLSTAITTTGNAFSASKMIRTLGFQSDRGVKKTYGNLSAFTYAFGVGSNYTPATVQLTSAPTTYGTITARPVNSRHQLTVAANTNNLTYYWKVESVGFTGVGATAVSHAYQYVESSVAPVGDDVNYVPARYNPTTWTVINNVTQVDDTNNIISFAGVGYIDGEFTTGVPAAFGIVKIFYSKRSGNWSDTAPSTTPWSNVSHSGPDATTTPVAGDEVYIGDGATFNHVITITSNNQSAGGLEINTGSTLDVGVYTGHNFGTFTNSPISGSGLLRISSAAATAEFPAGDFGNFIRATGGTVEYYTTGAQDFTIPISSAVPTVLPLISYKNLILAPAAGRYIVLPNQDERIYGNLIVQGASAGVARLNSVSSKTLAINNDLFITGGNLQFQNGTPQGIQVDNNVNIGSGASFSLVVANAVVANSLSIEGSLVNNGTLDFANASYICNTTFIGATNTSITGTGSTTDFNILTVSKGTSPSSILNVNASAFSLSGPTLPLVLNNGTFRLSSAQTVTIANTADFNIPSTAKLSANGGTFQVTGGDGVDLLLAGTLEILNGGVNVGTTSNDNSIEYAATGQPTIDISNGTLNIRSQVRRSTASSQGGLLYNQSGGATSVGLTNAASTTRGVFEMLNPGSSFAMSGGILSIVRGSGSGSIADLYLQPASYTVTGGTVEIGTGVTSQTVDINTIIPLYNVSVVGTTNTAKLELNGLVLRGSLNIGSTNIFNASSFNVNIAGNFANSNAGNTTGVAVGGYQAGAASQTTTFNSSTSNQTITGLSGNLTNFGNLVINNTFASGSVSLQLNTNLQVNGTLTLSNGTLVGAANTITAISTISNSATHTSTAGGSLTLVGSSNQAITGNGSGKFGNVVLNNGSGATFYASQEVTGTLTFTNGILAIGANTLTLSNTSLTTIVGASSARYITTSGLLSDGGIVKAFAGSVTSGNFVFPIGVAGKYTPADYTITTGTTGGRVTIKPVNSKHPGATGPGTAYINYYWSVSHTITNLTSLTHTYTYVAADEAGILANYLDARFNGGAWTIGITAGNPNTTTRVITFTNTTDLTGDYTAGEPTAFVNPTTYTSIASGNWESDAAVWDIDPPGTGIGPPAGSFVIISTGHIVTMTLSTKKTATLDVRGQLNLGTTTGHDFGTVSTSGIGVRTIQIKSSTFPTGDFTTFTAAGGGTVEYDGVLTLPTQAIYNNLSFSSAGTKTMPNVDLTINGNFTINAGTISNAVSNKNITLTNATGDFTNNGTFIAGNGAIVIGRHLTNTGSANFIAGNGADGLKVGGNFTNNASATYISGADSLGVRGNFNNSSTFNGGTGAIRITGNLNNTAGTFTANAGIVAVIGSITNNAVYIASSGATTVRGSYVNSGASAVHQANANVLTITGSFTNSSTANFNANTGSLIVGGNWNNTATFNAGTGSVSFVRASGQTLTGATSFNNVNRNNGGSLTLNNNISIAGALVLNSGKIVTGSNTVNLTNTASQPVTGYNSLNFIDGKLSISYPNASGSSRFFPIGKGSIYRPVTIQQNAASTSPIVRVEMINTPPSGSFPASIEGLSEARYYSVDVISGTINLPTVELNFNTNGAADESITVPGNVHIVRATSSTGPWTDEGGSGVFSPAAPVGYATSGLTSLSNPTFFALGYQAQPLPITLKFFEAVLKNDAVELAWATYTEINNAYFTIERSADGFNFERVSSVEGAGNSKTLLGYRSTDVEPLTGVSYYRLKQTDFDGKFTYSKPVKIVYDRGNSSNLMLYPNPSSMANRVFIKLETTTNAYTQGHLVIANVSGALVYSGSVDLNSEVSLQDLGLKFKMEPGVYVLDFVSGDFHSVKKFIIF